MARQIVEGYFKGQDFDDSTKRNILICIICNPVFRIDSIRNVFKISPLIDALKKSDITEKEAFGVIIRLAVYGEMFDFSYEITLLRPTVLPEEIGKRSLIVFREKIKVGKETAQKAEKKAGKIYEQQKIQEYYSKLGLDNFIKDKKGKFVYASPTLYSAYQIVEGYFEGQEVDINVKIAILTLILNHTSLTMKGNMRFDKLAEIMELLEKKGIDPKSIYGIMINLAVSGSLKNREKDKSYTKILSKPDRIIKAMKKDEDCVSPQVTDDALQNALRKYENLQKRTIMAKDLAEAGVQGKEKIQEMEEALPSVSQTSHNAYVDLSDDAKDEVNALMELIFGRDDKDK